MKLTLLMLGGTLVHLAAAIPYPTVDSDMDFEDDLEERDDYAGQECIVPTSTHSNVVARTTTKAVSATSTKKTVTATKVNGPVATSNKNPYTDNGIKAGLSGFPGINLYATSAMDALSPYMGWYSDYTPNTTDYGHVQGIPMLWGDGNTCVSSTDVTDRVAAFWKAIKNATPKIMFGFYEPDCNCPMSSDMSDPVYGAKKWNEMLAPLAGRGTILGSPPLCKQSDEDWYKPFRAAGLHADWEVTSIHVNVYNLAGVQRDVEHYASLYGKPIWISELACVHAGNGFFNPCNNQAEIDNFLNTVIPWLEANETVVAYGASNGEGLGNVWPLTNSKGQLTHTGNTYLNALKNLHK